MGYWNKTDREESKPTWLTPAQKINCVRTVKGWEIPLDGTSRGGQLGGYHGATGITERIPAMELLVALPNDPVYNPLAVLALTGRAANLSVSAAGGTGYTSGTTVLYYQPGTVPISSTGSNTFIAVISGSTGAAGLVTIQAAAIAPGTYNANYILPGGIVHPIGFTGATAEVVHANHIDNWDTNPNFTSRGVTAWAGSGLTYDVPNFTPYITCPFTGDSDSLGGIDGTGLSFTTTTAGSGGTLGSYGLNAYGVSTLRFPGGQTAYIKVVANDTNFTNSLLFSELADGFGTRGNLIQGSNLLTASNVPTAIYEAFFGPTSAFNNNIAVFKINAAGATSNNGPYTVRLAVWDGITAAGATGETRFTVSFGPTAS